MSTGAPRPGWRLREREWAWFAAALVLCSLGFAAAPGVDLWAARMLHGPGGFAGATHPAVLLLHQAVPWLGRGAFLVALALALAGPRLAGWPGPRWRRRLTALGLAMLLGVGLLVNGALKEGWGRPRPAAVQELGGAARFVPAFRPSDQCRTNCSFVSGHAATGFALGVLGIFGAPATRRRWLLAGLAAGLLIGLARMSQGGHFLSDVLFSGLAMWFTHLALRAGWLRRTAWRRRRARSPCEPGGGADGGAGGGAGAARTGSWPPPAVTPP